MRKYLQDGQGWTDSIFHSIDWENFETAITKTCTSSKTDFSRYIKFTIDMVNTGEQKEKFTSKSSTAPTVSNNCPCCKTAIETTLHLYSCNHKQVKASLKASLETLFQTLQKLQIPLPVWLTIRAGIATVSNTNHKRPSIISPSLSAKIDSAYKAQTKIGWHNFLKGRISTEWEDLC